MGENNNQIENFGKPLNKNYVPREGDKCIATIHLVRV
jgi:hypothetical protein